MKVKVLAIATVIISGLTACGGKSLNNQDTHNHENCTEHDHRRHKKETPIQESFKVEVDSIMVETDTVKHNHTHDHSCDGHDQKY